MHWNSIIKDFKYYCNVERSLSVNTTLAYLRDLKKLQEWSTDRNITTPGELTTVVMREFLHETSTHFKCQIFSTVDL